MVGPFGSVGGFGSESPHDCSFAPGAGAAGKRSYAPLVRGELGVCFGFVEEVFDDPVDGVGVVAEDQDLAPVTGVFGSYPGLLSLCGYDRRVG